MLIHLLWLIATGAFAAVNVDCGSELTSDTVELTAAGTQVIQVSEARINNPELLPGRSKVALDDLVKLPGELSRSLNLPVLGRLEGWDARLTALEERFVQFIEKIPGEPNFFYSIRRGDDGDIIAQKVEVRPLTETDELAFNSALLADNTELATKIMERYEIGRRLVYQGPYPARPVEQTDFHVFTSTAPISAENMANAYARGYKLYYHFDQKGAEPQWEFPAYRGVLNFSDTRALFKGEADFVLKDQNRSYPKQVRKLAYDKNEAGHPDLNKPLYEIRFTDPEVVVQQAALADRRMQNTVTKEVYRNADGRSLLWNRTWLTPQIQNAFIDFIKKGKGYAIGIYTTEHHKWHDRNVPGGHLVAGTFGIQVNGTVTGISIFMDRTRIDENREPAKDHPNPFRFDGAGKLAFMAEIDFLESIGITWLDCVTVNAAPRELGAYFVPREEFVRKIEQESIKPIPIKVPSGNYQIRYDYWMKPPQAENRKQQRIKEMKAISQGNSGETGT